MTVTICRPLRVVRSRHAVAVFACGVLLCACERPPMHTQQLGYRGLDLAQVTNPRLSDGREGNDVVPIPLPKAQVPAGAPRAGDTFENVQVLKDLSVTEFARVMVAMTSWVAPEQGCTYCHTGPALSSDARYTKVVARRMLQMTRNINGNWRAHVANTGVTCYTCHRGKNVPEQIWFTDPRSGQPSVTAGNRAGMKPAPFATLMPNDPFTTFLDHPGEVSVIPAAALRQDGALGPSIKQAEQTYGLMMIMAQSLGVNCDFCHNTRSFFDWSQSTPQRVTAWYGIRMVRDLNTHYLDPLQPTFPANRRGPLGDSPKIYCATCHQGVHKPLNGVSMLADYPELEGAP